MYASVCVCVHLCVPVCLCVWVCACLRAYSVYVTLNYLFQLQLWVLKVWAAQTDHIYYTYYTHNNTHWHLLLFPPMRDYRCWQFYQCSVQYITSMIIDFYHNNSVILFLLLDLSCSKNIQDNDKKLTWWISITKNNSKVHAANLEVYIILCFCG